MNVALRGLALGWEGTVEDCHWFWILDCEVCGLQTKMPIEDEYAINVIQRLYNQHFVETGHFNRAKERV